MPPKEKPQFENFEQAQAYVVDVRDHYRNDHGDYRGRRDEDQRLIAEFTSDEAHMIIDGVAIGLLGLLAIQTGESVSDELPFDDQEPAFYGHSWNEMRTEYGRLLSAFAVMTHRMKRDGYEVPSYFDMVEEDRMKAASVLLGDFLHHNGLRFGTQSSGVLGTERKTVYTDDGGVERQVIISDRDKAKTEEGIARNIATRGFVSNARGGRPNTHAAGKLSPDEYIELRREYPEVDKDKFDYDVGFSKNVRESYESKED